MNFTKEEISDLVGKAIEKGFDHYRKGENGQAEAIFSQVLCVDPENTNALQLLGLIESKKPGMGETAIARLKKAEELEPDSPDVHNNLGLVYSWSETKNMEEATRHYLRAIELNPSALHFYSNLGIHYKTMNLPEFAEEVLLRGLEIEDASTMLHFNYATLLGEQRRWAEAKHHYARAIELDPDFASAHYNLATVLLNEGNLEEGWKEYEWRWETYPAFKKIYDRLPAAKRWDGQTEPSGKRFFLYAEQGMGDTIQFSRFTKNLRERGAYVILEEHSDLVKLMKTLDGPNEIVRLGEAIPDYDFHCSVLSLPYLLGINSPSIISGKPYLRCNYGELPDMTILHDEYWKIYDGLRVGIVWAGNPVHRHDANRSTYLRNFKALQMPGAKLFSLQKDTRTRFWPGIGERDLTEGAEGMKVVDLKDFMIDYNASAAVIDKMDIVITVDTATAHLAAAMGKMTWILLAYHNDWRWFQEGSRTPWYSNVTLFRQPSPNDWGFVFEDVKQALAHLIETRQ